MPEGPWIKRNEHGVIFTQDMIQQDNSSIFDSSVVQTQREDEMA